MLFESILNQKVGKMEFKKILEKLLYLIFPNKCPFCEKLIAIDELKCSECSEILKNSSGIRILPGGYPCVFAYTYDGLAKTAIKNFKFNNKISYAKTFAKDICEVIKTRFPKAKISAITYVPLSKKRKRDRGYNQAEILAKEIGASLDVPVVGLLKKVKDNPAQHNIPNKSGRINNVQGVYEAQSYPPSDGGYLILCDDIVTTGSTLDECAKVLTKSGVKNLICAAVTSSQIKV